MRFACLHKDSPLPSLKKINSSICLALTLSILFSCSDESSESNSYDINSPNEGCGVDTTFTLDRLDFVIVRSPNCTYTTYGNGIEMIDELGNVIWSEGGSRTSPYSMNTTSDGGYIFTFTITSDSKSNRGW